jgi:ABC-type nickel/cobalt efflux system permease component RcnA
MVNQLYSLQLWVRDVLMVQLDRATDGGILTVAAILPLGVLFGALHALTPGHSKSVLAAYLLGSENSAFRGVGVAGILSLTHVGMGVLLALLGAPLITTTLVGAGRAPSIEAVSRGIIIAIGAWLILRAIWRKPHNEREGQAFGAVAGLVPCPLTLFVMFAAVKRGIPEIGLLWALAMAAGVMVTLAATALVAVFARNAMLRLVAAHGHRLERLSRLAEGAAGLVLIVMAGRELAI